MDIACKRVALVEAIEDLENRTLASFSSRLAKLVYLASLRDYNTGRYFHDGFVRRFGDRVASEALTMCHREIFQGLACSPLRDVVRDLDTYLNSLGSKPEEVLAAWRDLSVYRVVMPLSSCLLMRELFSSNIKCALAMLQVQKKLYSENQSAV